MSQAALLVQGQDLLAKVSKVVHMSPTQVSAQITATARGDVSALDVTGIAPTAGQAVLLANTAAGYLNVAARLQSQEQYASAVATASDSVKSFQKQINTLLAQINANPPDVEVLRARLTSVENQYTQAFSALQSLGPQAPLFTLSTLAPATPVPINSRGYDYRLNYNINFRGQAAGTTSSAPTNFNETSFSTPTQIGKSTRIALGGAAGLVLGATSAFLIEAWDDRIRRRDRVEELTGLPVLAEVPKLSREQIRSHAVPVADSPTGRAAERYRAARTSVLFALQAFDTTAQPHGFDDIAPTGVAAAGAAERAPVIMVTSPSPSEGKSTSCASLAAAFADNGLRTLVVDGDFRRPAVARYLSPVPNLVDPEMPATTRIDGVSFIAAPRGVDTPADAVYRLRRAIARWQDQFDIVLLDTPPMLTTNDATDLLAAADAVVLVLRSGQTRTGPAERVAGVLSRFRADVLGIILNGCENADMDPYYAYGYGYGYTGKKGKGGGYGGPGVFSPSPKDDPEHQAHLHHALAARATGVPTDGAFDGGGVDPVGADEDPASESSFPG